MSHSDTDSDDELTTIISMSRKRSKPNRSFRQHSISNPDKAEMKLLSQKRDTRSITTDSGRLTMVKGVHFNVASESFRRSETGINGSGINGSAVPGKQLVARVFHGMSDNTELNVPLWQGQVLQILPSICSRSHPLEPSSQSPLPPCDSWLIPQFPKPQGLVY